MFLNVFENNYNNITNYDDNVNIAMAIQKWTCQVLLPNKKDYDIKSKRQLKFDLKYLFCTFKWTFQFG